MWRDLPWMGVGQRWDGPASRRYQRHLGGLLNYFEPALPMDPRSLPAGVPLLAHSSELALATSGELNAGMLELLSAQVRSLGSPWAGEHMGLNSTLDTGELGYNFSPLLDAATIDATSRHVARVKRAYGCPLALEAGPRYYAWGGVWDDHAAILEVAQRTDSAIIVDISHHLCSMLNLGRDHHDGLSPAVLGRTIELHITGIGIHRTRGYYHDCHDQPVSEEAWRLLRWALARTPNLKAITLEHSPAVADDDYDRDLARLCTLVDERRRP